MHIFNPAICLEIALDLIELAGGGKRTADARVTGQWRGARIDCGERGGSLRGAPGGSEAELMLWQKQDLVTWRRNRKGISERGESAQPGCERGHSKRSPSLRARTVPITKKQKKRRRHVWMTAIPLHIRIIVKSLNAKCELLYHSQKLYVSTFSPFAESHSELRSELKLPLIFLNRLYLKENTDFPSSTQSHR